MASDIIRLLNKKGKLTGAEVGNLVIKDLVYMLVNKTDDGILTEAEIETAVNSLTENIEIKAYNKRSQIASFLGDLNQRCMYGDLMLSKKLSDINLIIRESKRALEIYEIEKPIRLSYEKYEEYKKEQLNSFYKSIREKVTLFELVLMQTQELYQKEKGEVYEAIEKHSNEPLTDQQRDFYINYFGGEYKEKEVSNLAELYHKATELMNQEKYKEAVILVADINKKIRKNTEKEPYDKADFIYNLQEFWEYKDKSKEEFFNIIKEYKDILAISLQTLKEEHFKQYKFQKITLEDTIEISFSIKELSEKYKYNYLKEALRGKTIIVSPYGCEETIDEISRRFSESIVEIIEPNTYKDMFELYDEISTFLENINKLYDLLAEETGVTEIKQLKYIKNDENINYCYITLLNLFMAMDTLDGCKEVEPIRLALEKMQELNLSSKKVTDKKINEARELLNSSNNFKTYQTKLFSLFTGN